MVQQWVHAKKTTPLQGVLLVLGLLVGLMIASVVSNISVQLTGSNWFSLLIWLLAIGLGVWLMRDRVLEYRYSVTEGMLYLERMYGQQAKLLLSLPVMEILEFGPAADLQARHPEIKNAMHLTRPSCAYPKMAISYKKDGQLQLAILQPDPDMTAALWNEEARRLNHIEKWGE